MRRRRARCRCLGRPGVPAPTPPSLGCRAPRGGGVGRTASARPREGSGEEEEPRARSGRASDPESVRVEPGAVRAALRVRADFLGQVHRGPRWRLARATGTLMPPRWVSSSVRRCGGWTAGIRGTQPAPLLLISERQSWSQVRAKPPPPPTFRSFPSPPPFP